MLFNPWRIFKETKPIKDGWYTCTVEVSGQQRYVMDLYWYNDTQQFIDNRRQDIFDSYKVLNYIDIQMASCQLCNRTQDVVAWKKQPRPYMKGFKKEI